MRKASQPYIQPELTLKQNGDISIGKSRALLMLVVESSEFLVAIDVRQARLPSLVLLISLTMTSFVCPWNHTTAAVPTERARITLHSCQSTKSFSHNTPFTKPCSCHQVHVALAGGKFLTFRTETLATVFSKTI